MERSRGSDWYQNRNQNQNRNQYGGQGVWPDGNNYSGGGNNRGGYNFGRGYVQDSRYAPGRYNQSAQPEQIRLQPDPRQPYQQQPYQPNRQPPFENGFGGQRGRGRQGGPKGKRKFNNNRFPNNRFRGQRQPRYNKRHSTSTSVSEESSNNSDRSKRARVEVMEEARSELEEAKKEAETEKKQISEQATKHVDNLKKEMTQMTTQEDRGPNRVGWRRKRRKRESKTQSGAQFRIRKQQIVTSKPALSRP